MGITWHWLGELPTPSQVLLYIFPWYATTDLHVEEVENPNSSAGAVGDPFGSILVTSDDSYVIAAAISNDVSLNVLSNSL